MTRASTTVSRIIKAPRAAVYKACLDADTLAKWRGPDNMTARVHVFEARAGGTYPISLIYLDPPQSPGGKTSEDHAPLQGPFRQPVPDQQSVQELEFQTPAS